MKIADPGLKMDAISCLRNSVIAVLSDWAQNAVCGTGSAAAARSRDENNV